MSVDDNKTLVRRFYEEVWDRGNTDFAFVDAGGPLYLRLCHARAGEDVVQVSKPLGHSSPAITQQRYA